MNALIADAKPRCRCDSVGVDLCPAGCGAQRDRMVLAELLHASAPDNPKNTEVTEDGDQTQMPITAAGPKLYRGVQPCSKCMAFHRDEPMALVGASKGAIAKRPPKKPPPSIGAMAKHPPRRKTK